MCSHRPLLQRHTFPAKQMYNFLLRSQLQSPPISKSIQIQPQQQLRITVMEVAATMLMLISHQAGLLLSHRIPSRWSLKLPGLTSNFTAVNLMVVLRCGPSTRSCRSSNQGIGKHQRLGFHIGSVLPRLKVSHSQYFAVT